MADAVQPQVSIAVNTVDPVPPHRTYVCFGLERGGTSAVAGVMRGLGLPMGDNLDGNNEDPEFHARTLGQMRATIRLRNDQHPVWGWKYPTAAKYLPGLMRALREPFFVVVSRDVTATALGRKKWDGDFLDKDIALSLHDASAATATNTSLAMSTGRPALFVSYERLVTRPREFVREMAAFLGIEAPNGERLDRFEEYLEPGAYKQFEDFFPQPGRADIRRYRRTFG